MGKNKKKRNKKQKPTTLTQPDKAKTKFLKSDHSKQNAEQSKLFGIKISSYKLKQSKSHRKNSLNHKKNALESNLISLGHNPKNMSLMKQRKLLNKTMKELLSS